MREPSRPVPPATKICVVEMALSRLQAQWEYNHTMHEHHSAAYMCVPWQGTQQGGPHGSFHPTLPSARRP